MTTDKEYQCKMDKLEVGLTFPLAEMQKIIINLSLTDDVLDADELVGLTSLASVVCPLAFLEESIKYLYLSKKNGFISQETYNEKIGDLRLFLDSDFKQEVRQNFETVVRYFQYEDNSRN